MRIWYSSQNLLDPPECSMRRKERDTEHSVDKVLRLKLI